MVVCIVSECRRKSRWDVTNVIRTFALAVTGVMNIKPIMKFASVTDVTPFIAATAMRWINATIAEKSFVLLAPPF